MKMRKILAAALAAALLLSAIAGISVVGTDNGSSVDTASTGGDAAALPSVPAVTIRGVQVNGDDRYLELGLDISASSFQTVGVVLSYDATALQPVTWMEATGAEEAEETVAEGPAVVDVIGSGWTASTVIPTKGADGLAGKPALAYAKCDETTGESTDRAYLYLGADALQYTDLDNQRVVTVRFRYCQGTTKNDITMPVLETDDPTDEDAFTIAFAPAAVVEESIPGCRLLTTVGGDYHETQENVTAYTAQFALGPGDSVNTGKDKGGSGDYAITFFDWDGRVIDAIAAPNDAEDVVREWQTQRADIQARLTNKPGYAFDKWLVVYEDNDGNGLHTKGGTFTSNDGYLSATNPDIADFSDLEKLIRPDSDAENKRVSNAVMVQAAYVAKSVANGFKDADGLVNGGSTDPADRFYTISEPVFTRYGAVGDTTGSYSLTMTVTRNKGVNGVTRLREPGIWVLMTPTTGGSAIYNLLRLENTDSTTFEIVTNKQISKVEYKVIDTYGISNWTGCANRSLTLSKDRVTCIVNGTLGYLADQAFAVTHNTNADGSAVRWEEYVNAQTFVDCYANDTGNNHAKLSYWTDTKIANAKTALENASQGLTTRLDYADVLRILGGV